MNATEDRIEHLAFHLPHGVEKDHREFITLHGVEVGQALAGEARHVLRNAGIIVVAENYSDESTTAWTLLFGAFVEEAILGQRALHDAGFSWVGLTTGKCYL